MSLRNEGPLIELESELSMASHQNESDQDLQQYQESKELYEKMMALIKIDARSKQNSQLVQSKKEYNAQRKETTKEAKAIFKTIHQNYAQLFVLKYKLERFENNPKHNGVRANYERLRGLRKESHRSLEEMVLKEATPINLLKLGLSYRLKAKLDWEGIFKKQNIKFAISCYTLALLLIDDKHFLKDEIINQLDQFTALNVSKIPYSDYFRYDAFGFVPYLNLFNHKNVNLMFDINNDSEMYNFLLKRISIADRIKIISNFQALKESNKTNEDVSRADVNTTNNTNNNNSNTNNNSSSISNNNSNAISAYQPSATQTATFFQKPASSNSSQFIEASKPSAIQELKNQIQNAEIALLKKEEQVLKKEKQVLKVKQNLLEMRQKLLALEMSDVTHPNMKNDALMNDCEFDSDLDSDSDSNSNSSGDRVLRSF